MIDIVLSFFSNYLIEVMGCLLTAALFFRFLAYRQSRRDGNYFSSFTREIESIIESDREEGASFDNSEDYLNDLLGRASKRLPSRSLRNINATKTIKVTTEGKEREVVSLNDFVSSKQGLISSIQAESSIFNSKTAPNFNELTHRVLDQDKNWTKLMGHIPIDWVTRMIDILPNIFIVFGVFGTFIGISMALPEIANIDFNNLEGSQKTLTSFVLSVTFAMKTSIAGIFCSLILTFLNTLFPIMDTRKRVFKKVETCFQMLWYHIQRDNSNLSAEQLMSEMLNTLKNINSEISNQRKVS